MPRANPILVSRPRKRRNRSLRTLAPGQFLPQPPTPTAVLVTGVYQGGAGSDRFFWTFDDVFDNTPAGGGTWELADFASFRISGQEPTEIDEIIGGDKLVGLVYGNLPDPDEATLWELVGAVPKIVFPDGRTLGEQSGEISR